MLLSSPSAVVEFSEARTPSVRMLRSSNVKRFALIETNLNFLLDCITNEMNEKISHHIGVWLHIYVYYESPPYCERSVFFSEKEI